VLDHETGRGVAGVTVALAGTDRRTTTAADGRFAFPSLPAATYRVEFRGLGYGERIQTLVLAEGQTQSLEVRLSPRPVDLPAIAVTIRTDPTLAWLAQRGFTLRAAEGKAMLHATRDQLRQQSSRNLNELLGRVPGVRVRRLVDAGSQLLLEPSPLPGGAPCRVAIYLNGSHVELGRFNWTGENWNQRGSRPVRFDDLVTMSQIDGLELFGPEQNPVASDTTCGALLIWSSVLRPRVDEDFAGTIRGRAVNDQTGAALPGVRVSIRPAGRTTETDAQGRFELAGLTPGDYELRAEFAGAASWLSTVTVQAYGHVELELRLTIGRPPAPARSGGSPAAGPPSSPGRRSTR